MVSVLLRAVVMTWAVEWVIASMNFWWRGVVTDHADQVLPLNFVWAVRSFDSRHQPFPSHSWVTESMMMTSMPAFSQALMASM